MRCSRGGPGEDACAPSRGWVHLPLVALLAGCSPAAEVEGEGRRRNGAAGAERPHVVLYLIDTLRQDRLGCYGYDRPVSPRIDGFARRATRFTDALGQSSWTKPSVASIFTGRWPLDHGALDKEHHLAGELRTLAELLGEAGYRTAAFATNPNVTPTYGFDQGFEEFHRHLKAPSDRIHELVTGWLAERTDDRPFFLFVHTMDPHAPYEPPEEYRRRLAADALGMEHWQGPRWKWPARARPHLSRLYDAEVAFADASFGALLDRLGEEGLADRTMVVLTSDHGEEFLDHGRWVHGKNLHRSTLDVPLLIRFPGQRRGRVDDRPAQHVDLLPTILDVAGVPVPPEAEGSSLRHPLPDAARGIFSHLELGRAPEQRSLVVGEWKLTQRRNARGWDADLYHRPTDPREAVDLERLFPVRAAIMAGLLEARADVAERPRGVIEPAAPEIEPEIQEALEALGYVE